MTIDELRRLWAEQAPPPSSHGAVRLICTRAGDGVHECPERVSLTLEAGVEGDRWSRGPGGDPERQVTLISARVVEVISRDGQPPHLAGDNFVVDLDISEAALPVGTRLRIGGAALRVSAVPHSGCKKFRERFGMAALEWVNHQDTKGLRLRGVMCRVVEAGDVSVGDPISVID